MSTGGNYTLRGQPFRKTVEASFYVSSLHYAWMGQPFFTNSLGEPIPGGGNVVLLKVGGAFKTVSATLIKVDGAWEPVSSGKLKRGGAWVSIEL